jgi:hypothetical protein
MISYLVAAKSGLHIIMCQYCHYILMYQYDILSIYYYVLHYIIMALTPYLVTTIARRVSYYRSLQEPPIANSPLALDDFGYVMTVS